MINKILVILLCSFIISCAGGTRGTGAIIDRRFTDSPGIPEAKQEKSLYDALFEPECDPYEEDCS